MHVLLVGAGKMGSAMLRRWHDQRLADDILVIDTARNMKSPADLPGDFTPEVIVFAVKPQTLPDILPDYKKFTDAGALVISVAAGRTTGFFKKYLGDNAAIVRTMPNTPASIGEGITGVYAPANVSAVQRDIALSLLSPVGEVVWVDHEDQLDAVTAVSGSGPAYVFLMIEAMAQAGEQLGLSPETAMKLARQTIIGAGALAQAEPQNSARILRESVTSPNGTTAAALTVLMRDGAGLKELMQKALRAANDRAKELNS